MCNILFYELRKYSKCITLYLSFLGGGNSGLSLLFHCLEGQSFILQLHNQEWIKVCLNGLFSCLNRAFCINLYQFFAFQNWFLTLQEVFSLSIVRLCLKVPFSCLKLHCIVKIWRNIHFKQVFVHLRQLSFFFRLNSDTIEGSFF